MIRKLRARISNKKGFTLAELLIVVAIVAVLAAIALPVFGTQLKKAKDAVETANLRAIKSEATATEMTSDSPHKDGETVVYYVHENGDISTTDSTGTGTKSYTATFNYESDGTFKNVTVVATEKKPAGG